MVVCVHLLQDTERTIIPYLNKKETLEGLLNDGYRTWKNKLTNHPFGQPITPKVSKGFNTLYLRLHRVTQTPILKFSDLHLTLKFCYYELNVEEEEKTLF